MSLGMVILIWILTSGATAILAQLHIYRRYELITANEAVIEFAITTMIFPPIALALLLAEVLHDRFGKSSRGIFGIRKPDQNKVESKIQEDLNRIDNLCEQIRGEAERWFKECEKSRQDKRPPRESQTHLFGE